MRLKIGTPKILRRHDNPLSKPAKKLANVTGLTATTLLTEEALKQAGILKGKSPLEKREEKLARTAAAEDAAAQAAAETAAQAEAAAAKLAARKAIKPIPDIETEQRAARRKRAKLRASRKGRSSTLLSKNRETLG